MSNNNHAETLIVTPPCKMPLKRCSSEGWPGTGTQKAKIKAPRAESHRSRLVHVNRLFPSMAKAASARIMLRNNAALR